MSRMLAALRQIEASVPHAAPAIQPVSVEELAAFGLRRLAATVTEDAGEPLEPTSEQPARFGPAVPVRGAAISPSFPLGAASVTPTLPFLGEGWGEGIVQPAPAVSDHFSDVSKTAATRDTPNKPRRFDFLAAGQPEPYRVLAENLLAQLPPGRSAAVMFTSPGEIQGKTTVLASLAAVLAEVLGEKIVAADANLADPGLTRCLGVWADRGLADVLRGEADWRSLVRKTSLPHLAALPSGRLAAERDLAALDHKLGAVLDALRRHYRFVLVDAPSLAFPGTATLSRFCDGTCVVVELGRTGRKAARRAVGLIHRRGGRVLGCVLFGVAAGQ